jgi:hypothetical protein
MLIVRRIGFPLLMLCFCLNSYAQTITGIVVDKASKQPINNALVNCGRAKTYTNTLGMFEIPADNTTDSLRITHFGYKTFMVLHKSTTVLRIEMESAAINLDAVTIHATRSFKQDSIDNRLTYARQFNYRAPKLTDAFSTDAKQPGELLSINLLTVVDLLTKKSTPQYKFNKTLLNDEHETYIDHKFNRGNVSRITGLKGDTLSTFLVQYRPTFQLAQKYTDYDMEVYIKSNFEKFKKDGLNASNPFHDAVNKDTVRVRVRLN